MLVIFLAPMGTSTWVRFEKTGLRGTKAVILLEQVHACLPSLSSQTTSQTIASECVHPQLKCGSFGGILWQLFTSMLWQYSKTKERNWRKLACRACREDLRKQKGNVQSYNVLVWHPTLMISQKLLSLCRLLACNFCVSSIASPVIQYPPASFWRIKSVLIQKEECYWLELSSLFAIHLMHSLRFPTLLFKCNSAVLLKFDRSSR